jgi:hypothetical protein
MVSYKNLFLIKGMTVWNWLSETIQRTLSRITNLYLGVRDWFHPDSGSWYLYPTTLFPVPCSHYYQLGTSSWKYNPSTRELTYLSMEKGVTAQPIVYRIPWLTARISSGQTKDMDGFLEELRVIGSPVLEETIPPMVLLQAWSLHDKQWWSAMNPRLEWFDALAEEHSALCPTMDPIPLLPVRPPTCKN